jgi:hypothetical protein
MQLIWEQEAAGSNPAIPTGRRYFSNLESVPLKPLRESLVPGWASADVARRGPPPVHVGSHLLVIEPEFYSVRPGSRNSTYGQPTSCSRSPGGPACCRSRREVCGTVSLQDTDGRTSTSRRCPVACVGSMMVRAVTATWSSLRPCDTDSGTCAPAEIRQATVGYCRHVP